jgi:hypothetical protein
VRVAAQGKYVILFFYPLDFTFVCPTEITAFSDKHAEFANINTEVRQSCRWALSGQGSLQRLYCYSSSLQVMVTCVMSACLRVRVMLLPSLKCERTSFSEGLAAAGACLLKLFCGRRRFWVCLWTLSSRTWPGARLVCPLCASALVPGKGATL